MKRLWSVILTLALGLAQAAHASLDGTPSTGSFLVVDSTGLSAATATGYVQFLSTTGALRSNLTIGAHMLKESVQWRVGTSTTTAVASLAAAINAVVPHVTAAPSTLGKVVLTASGQGSLYNSISLKSSTPTAMAVSGATLTGGLDDIVLGINGETIKQGRDFIADDNTSGTAVHIAAAINSHPVLSAIVEAMPLSARVYLRTKLKALAYALTSSAPGHVLPFASAMYGGSSGNLARFGCNLGRVGTLPTANYSKGCLAFQTSDDTQYVATEDVTGAGSWAPIVAGAIDSSKLEDGAVVNSKIATGTIDTTKMKVYAGADDTGKIPCYVGDSQGRCKDAPALDGSCTCGAW
jgi:hypothetical protein